MQIAIFDSGDNLASTFAFSFLLPDSPSLISNLALSSMGARAFADFTQVLALGTNPGTGTGYHTTALLTVGPYALPVPGFVAGNTTIRRCLL